MNLHDEIELAINSGRVHVTWLGMKDNLFLLAFCGSNRPIHVQWWNIQSTGKTDYKIKFEESL